MHKQDQSSGSTNSIESRFPVDFKDHAGTRLENDRRLLPMADEIESGDNIENLERFAKAYLGMYLDMDNSIPPLDRIHILANPALANRVLAGFLAVLQKRAFARAQDIADSIYTAHLAEGYILLAALDIFGREKPDEIPNLPANTLVAAICFSYAYKHSIHQPWLDSIVLHQPEVAIHAFSEFWRQLIIHNTDHLPGIFFIIRKPDYDHIASAVLLPILEDWLTVRKKLLRDLLRCALRTVDHKELYKLSASSVANWNRAEPGRYILWLAVAFILQPTKFRPILNEYVGRTKEKLLPLLDFCYWVFYTDQLKMANFDADGYATLIRMIASRITPQKDRYGELCDNTRKVMFLFYRLACSSNKHVAIEQLLKVRVMKLYEPILKYIDTETFSPDDTSLPEQLDGFLNNLTRLKLIQPRIKWSD